MPMSCISDHVDLMTSLEQESIILMLHFVGGMYKSAYFYDLQWQSAFLCSFPSVSVSQLRGIAVCKFDADVRCVYEIAAYRCFLCGH